jgi:predicted ester cyclase
MSKFNQQLEAYIDGAIQQAIEEAHETLNGRIEKLVNKLNYLNGK